MVQSAGDTESKAAKDLLSWVSDTRRMIKTSSTNPLLDYVNSLKNKTHQYGESSQASDESV
jgi:hypothetical protein